MSDPLYLEKLDAVETLESQLSRVQAKLDLALDDELEKGQPYRDDPYFTYLFHRRYGQKDAKGWTLTKLLDDWVARLIGYKTAAVNYRRLRAIPERIKTHFKTLEEKLESARLALAQTERDKLVADGVENKRQASLLEQARLEKIDAKITQTETDLTELRRIHSALISGHDGPYREALTLISDTLSKVKIPSLQALAAQTRSPEDDEATAEIARLRDQIQDLEAEKSEYDSVLKRYQSGLMNLESLRRQFKQSRFDAPYSQFPSGKSLFQTLLQQLLLGAVSTHDVWRRISRAQRTIQRKTDIDFGGIDWGEAMRLPRNYPRQSRRGSGGIFSGGYGGGWGGGSSRRRSTPRISRPTISRPRRSRSSSGRSGGFRTGGGF